MAAHNSDRLPWDAIAQNLKWVSATVGDHGTTDLHFRLRPDQEKDFQRFAQSFAELLEEKSAEERRKYPDVYDPPREDDVVLDDRVVQKINPLIQRYDVDQFIRKEIEAGWMEKCRIIASANGEEWFDVYRRLDRRRTSRRGDPISDYNRLMKAFLREEKDYGCYDFLDKNGKLYYAIEIVKALLVTGEMGTLLRIAAHPKIDWDPWASFLTCGCMVGYPESGWMRVFRTTLHTYILLNVLHHLRETFGADKDYRDVRCYQEMLRTCATNATDSEITSEIEPHRRFFGIGPDYFTIDGGQDLMESDRWQWLADKDPDNDDAYPYGLMPINEFLGCETGQEVVLGCYLPTAADASAVQRLLIDKGLPAEIALDILELARYEDLGGMRIAHDPFHPGNSDVLIQYLDECWRILVHCYILKEHVKKEEEVRPRTTTWIDNVKDCLHRIWWTRL